MAGKQNQRAGRGLVMDCAITQALKELSNRLEYHPCTGEFRWKKASDRSPSWNARYAGKAAGCRSNGYVAIGITLNGKTVKVLAHRLAFFVARGRLPSCEIDHINGIRSDNRLINLREATASINQRNARRRVDNTSGYTGVTFCRRSMKWMAKAEVNGIRKHLGLFESILDASKVVMDFRSINGFTGRHGS